MSWADEERECEADIEREILREKRRRAAKGLMPATAEDFEVGFLGDQFAD